MADIGVDKLIGKTLWAKKNVDILNGDFKKIGIVQAGKPIGVIYSWIERPGKIYFQINTKAIKSGAFWVEYKQGYFDPNKGGINQAIQIELIKQKAELKKEENKLEDLQKEEKGVIPYYIEKYGPWILGTVILISFIKSRK